MCILVTVTIVMSTHVFVGMAGIVGSKEVTDLVYVLLGDSFVAVQEAVNENLTRMSGTNVNGLRRWNGGVAIPGIPLAHDRQAWAVVIRDVFVVMGTCTSSSR